MFEFFFDSRDTKWGEELCISFYIKTRKRRSSNLLAPSVGKLWAVRSRSHRRMWETAGRQLHLLQSWEFQNVRSVSWSVEKTCLWGSLFTSVPLLVNLFTRTSSFLVGGEKRGSRALLCGWGPLISSRWFTEMISEDASRTSGMSTRWSGGRAVIIEGT